MIKISFVVVGQLFSSGIGTGFKFYLKSILRVCFCSQVETKGKETNKNNAGPAASQETQGTKPRAG